jgi:hypothetical protein
MYPVPGAAKPMLPLSRWVLVESSSDWDCGSVLHVLSQLASNTGSCCAVLHQHLASNLPGTPWGLHTRQF